MLPASNSHLNYSNFTNILFYDITPLIYMKYKTRKSKNVEEKTSVVGMVILDLAVWDFSNNEDIIRHNANEISKAILFSYQLANFGPHNFGIPDDEMGDE